MQTEYILLLGHNCKAIKAHLLTTLFSGLPVLTNKNDNSGRGLGRELALGRVPEFFHDALSLMVYEEVGRLDQSICRIQCAAEVLIKALCRQEKKTLPTPANVVSPNYCDIANASHAILTLDCRFQMQKLRVDFCIGDNLLVLISRRCEQY